MKKLSFSIFMFSILLAICVFAQQSSIIVEDAEAQHGYVCQEYTTKPCMTIAPDNAHYTEGANALKMTFYRDADYGEGADFANSSFVYDVRALTHVGFDLYVEDSSICTKYYFNLESYDCQYEFSTSNGWNNILFDVTTYGEYPCSRAEWIEFGETSRIQMGCSTGGANGTVSYIWFDNLTFFYDYTTACVPPHISADWLIDNVNCKISSAEYLGGGDLYLINGGNLTLTAPLTFTGSDNIIAVDTGSQITIESGGSFNG